MTSNDKPKESEQAPAPFLHIEFESQGSIRFAMNATLDVFQLSLVAAYLTFLANTKLAQWQSQQQAQLIARPQLIVPKNLKH